MKYKAVFIDVDGTLLTDDLTISAGTKEIITDLHQQGILIAIVTARPPNATLPFYKELGIIENPVICFNGALVIRNDQILDEEIIALQDARKIINEVRNFKISISIYKHHTWYTNQLDSWIAQESQITNCVATQIELDKLITDDFYANKIMLMGESDALNAVSVHLKSIGFENLNIHKSKPTYLEIVSNRASKSKGIQKVISARNITTDQIITIGDNFNDVDMFLLAGTSIAMGNAPDAVKKQATLVTDTNNADGIKKALRKLLIAEI
jgi:Cof subfamily protein (haloacid dehalogenase superfamily)